MTEMVWHLEGIMDETNLIERGRKERVPGHIMNRSKPKIKSLGMRW